jgi:DNA-binding MarR family transcriptional regulator
MNIDLLKEFGRTINMTERLRKQYSHPVNNTMSADRGQGRVLVLLNTNKDISQKELLYLLDCRPQSLAESLKKLEVSGLINRFQSIDDKRILNIELTSEGKFLANNIIERTRIDKGPLSNALDILSDQEKNQMLEYMEKINKSLETSMLESGFGLGKGSRMRQGQGQGNGFGNGRGRRGR